MNPLVSILVAIVTVINVHPVICGPASLTPNNFIGDVEREGFRQILSLKRPQDEDSSGLYYSILGLNIVSSGNILKEIPSKDIQTLCSLLYKWIESKTDNRLDDVYHASSALKLLGSSCPQVKAPGELIKFLESEVRETSSVQTLCRSVNSLLNLNQKVDSAKILKYLQVSLKRDEQNESVASGLLATGLSFQLVSRVSSGVSLNPWVEKVSDVLIQADEVDGRLLQFEGGLSVTSNVIRGIYQLASAANKPVSGLSEVSSAMSILHVAYPDDLCIL